MPASNARIAVLLSGRGSNFLALEEAIRARRIPARIVLVVANRQGAPGLLAASKLGIDTALIPHRGLTRKRHEDLVLAALGEARVEWVCLAGYMRLLSSRFVNAYEHRILNIHPSLLPSFPGLDAQRQALEYGVGKTGCTVHLVDSGLDSGPIVEQRVVDVRSDDTEESLSQRILIEEHRAYPRALERLLTESWVLDGRRVSFRSARS